MEQDPVALLIPWYAAGSLPDDERALVDRHLPSCASCRELLAGATEHAALFADARRADEHVHPRLLVRWAEAPQSLDADTREGIEARLARCETCRAALAILRETERPAASVERRSFLDILRSTILAPAPALAYLLLLALLVPLFLRRGGEEGAGSPVLGVPTVVRVEGERALRSGDEAARAEPLRISPPGQPEAPLLFLLVTDLAAEDLADPELTFAIEVTRTGRGPFTETRRGSDFTRDGGRVTLPLVISARPGEELSLAIRARKPGDPIDGRVLYRRKVQIGGLR